jgi:hypothetical protein
MNNQCASVPWRTLCQDINYKYLHISSLPDSFFLMNSSKLQVVGIQNVWNHWADREREKKQGLVFLKAAEGSGTEEERHQWIY